MKTRDATAGDPVLFAVDDPLIAFFVGTGRHLTGCTAGVWLSDANCRFVATQHHLGNHLALVIIAILHDRTNRAHIAFHRNSPSDATDLRHLDDQ